MPTAIGTGTSVIFLQTVPEATAMDDYFQLPLHITGALSQNVLVYWSVPFNCKVTHISAVGANDSDAALTFGISTDTDSILEPSAVGDLLVPATYTVADWSTVNPDGQLNAGDIATLLVDYDGAAGTGVTHLTIVITLLRN